VTERPPGPVGRNRNIVDDIIRFHVAQRSSAKSEVLFRPEHLSSRSSGKPTIVAAVVDVRCASDCMFAGLAEVLVA
jgi:hypothetical protein